MKFQVYVRMFLAMRAFQHGKDEAYSLADSLLDILSMPDNEQREIREALDYAYLERGSPFDRESWIRNE